jgi:transcriptional regulator GlxA family with amidase domain
MTSASRARETWRERAAGLVHRQRLLDAIVVTVDARASELRCTEDLAGAVGVSARHLTRVMTDHLGSTPRLFLEMAHLRVARVLLTRDYPLIDIAEMAGFASAAAMRRAFVRHHGVTPSTFRERQTRQGPFCQRPPYQREKAS